MNQIPCQDYIDKIILLENFSNRKRKYEIINPIDFKGYFDIVEIHKISKLLSNHIGYDDLIFTIVFKEFDSDTAGNVTLDYKEDVLIHISKSLWGFPDSILATLSHEISHKYIQLNRLTFSLTYENEVFTDLTSVYLGFGKLMLNGVEVIQKNSFGNTQRTITKKVGYLTREQLAFIYLAVNYLLGERRLSFYSNLKADVVETVKKVELEYNEIFMNIKYYQNKILKINSLRYKIAYLEKMINIVNPINKNELKEYVKFEFAQLNKTEIELENFKKEFFTRIVANPEKSRRTRKDIPVIKINSKEYNRFISMNRKLVNKDLKDSIKSKNLNIIECPVCKKNLKTKNDSIGIIVCPVCNFKFAVDTIYKIGGDNINSALKNSINKLTEFVNLDKFEKRRFINEISEKLKLYWLIN